MKYRKFGNTEVEISALGFGCMRFPTTEDGEIDEAKAIEMLRYGIDNGINYIDTAYMYHEYKSEDLVGKALQDGYREKVYLATKSPVFMMDSEAEFEKILNEQLEKLQTPYIDFYLLHSLFDECWEEKVVKWKLIEKMEKAKADGKIKHIGFSFHDEYDVFKKMIDYYDKWEFCQIQMNYVDVSRQATLEGMKYAADKGLGVIIMEPLLGGKLSNLPARVAECFTAEKTQTQWALEFLWDKPEVSFLLSGMSSMQHVIENVESAKNSSIGCVKEEDKERYVKAKDIFINSALVGCTKCSYCMPCPFGLDIPRIFEIYNKLPTSSEKGKFLKEYNTLEVKADACQKCQVCESVCPQHLAISTLMEEVHKAFSEIKPSTEED